MPFDPISYNLASKKAAKLHASQHTLGGEDEISVDASQITSGRFNVHILPKTDNTYDLGSSSLRWRNLYATNVYQGDLCFFEKECAVCGQPFKEGDEIVLKVNKIEDKGTHTIPIHLKCSDDYKELEERIRKLEAGV